MNSDICRLRLHGTNGAGTSITLQDGTLGIAGFAFGGCSGLTSIDIPESVVSIGNEAFSLCSGLSTIKLPSKLAQINNFCFSSCESLTSVDIPESVVSIGSYAFNYCPKLENVVLPKNLKSLCNNAFDGCSSLISITLPSTLTAFTFNSNVFKNCNNLTDVTVLWDTPINIESTSFPNRTSSTLHVPYGTKSLYAAADYWKEFKEITEERPQCAKPTITIDNGKLTFGCETEGVTFKASCQYDNSSSLSEGEELVLEGTTICHISVIATKEDYQDSDIATAEVEVGIGIKGDVNGDGAVDIGDAVRIVNKVVGKIDALAPSMTPEP